MKKLKNKLILGGVVLVAGALMLKKLFVWGILALGAYGSFKYFTRNKK